MKKHKLTFFVLLFLIAPLTIFGQDTKALYKEGHKLFRLEHYRKALPFLEKVVEAEPNNAEALFETGVCYLHRYSKEKALDYIIKSYTLDSNVSKYIHYWLGRAYHQNYMYDKAIREYNLYKADLGKSDQRRKDVEKHIEQTNTARQLTQNPENFVVRNLGPSINSIYSEHSPVTSKNDSLILFTSRRNDVTGGKEDYDGEFFEDIFQSKKLANGEWSTPEKVQLNTSGHDASIQLFDNDTKLLMYRQAKGGDIYVTEKDPATGAWKEPQKFANINTPDFEADAFITADGKTAYFATNHYKKIGDLDIYYVSKNEDGSWSKPQELQGRINTNEDEDAPFLTPDGKTLYFSSRGHKNMGGFDVFKSTLDSSGNWSNPVNIGYPINTPDDDVYYYLSYNGKKGYFSSYREGGYGEKDIYEIAPVPPAVIVCKIVPPCAGKQREGLNYSVKSLKKTTKPISLSGKVENDQFVANIYGFNSYRVSIYNSTDTVYSETVDVPFSENEISRIEKEISLACPEGEKKQDSLIAVEKKEENAIAHKYIFRNIVFEHGKTDLTAEGSREASIASEILKKNPTAEVRIVGASDGDEQQTLAAKRSKKIHDQLKASGVKNVMKDTTTRFKDETVDGRSVVLEVKLKEPLKTNFESHLIPKESIGDSYILRSIYFETAKAELNAEAKAELDILGQLLNEHPELKLEIAGFTDNKGSNEINLALSEKRARTALDYLVNKGISNERLEVKGYGKINPISTNASETGRRLNRRVDFRIKKK